MSTAKSTWRSQRSSIISNASRFHICFPLGSGMRCVLGSGAVRHACTPPVHPFIVDHFSFVSHRFFKGNEARHVLSTVEHKGGAENTIRTNLGVPITARASSACSREEMCYFSSCSRAGLRCLRLVMGTHRPHSRRCDRTRDRRPARVLAQRVCRKGFCI